MKILAVDDDRYILELLPMIVAEAGWRDIHTAISAGDALQAITSASPAFDCLLLDIQMPGVDGIELCRQVRAIPEYEKTPIIMLTAMAEKKYVHLAFQAGASDYLTKPFDVIELAARLRMANLLVEAQRSSAEPVRAEAESGGGAEALDHESLLSGFPNVIRRDALTNYLLQLSRSDISQHQVLAITVDQDSGGVNSILPQVASSIEYAMGVQSYLMAYVGDGVFICCCSSPGLLRPEALEMEIHSALRASEVPGPGGKPAEIDVAVGHPLRPTPGGKQHFEDLLLRAASQARNRRLKKRGMPKQPGIRSPRLPW